VIKDHINSTLALVTEAGVIEERYAYSPWGKRVQVSNRAMADTRTNLLTDIGFTGQRHIDEVGLIDMKARLYDPAMGLFLSPDPMLQDPFNPQNHNRTAYCLNDPVNKYDPSGMVWEYNVFSGSFEQDRTDDWSDTDAELDTYGRNKYDASGVYIPPFMRGEPVYYGSPDVLNTDNPESQLYHDMETRAIDDYWDAKEAADQFAGRAGNSSGGWINGFGYFTNDNGTLSKTDKSPWRGFDASVRIVANESDKLKPISAKIPASDDKIVFKLELKPYVNDPKVLASKVSAGKVNTASAVGSSAASTPSNGSTVMTGVGSTKPQGGGVMEAGGRPSYTPPPGSLPGFPDAERIRPKGGRPRWKLPDGDIGEWDGQHGEVERYNPRGKHKGVWDPQGKQIKPPVPGRTIDPYFSPNPELFRQIVTGGLIVGGAAIIIFDIVTIPSGEGMMGVMMINRALAH